jgi:hypothetical protein
MALPDARAAPVWSSRLAERLGLVPDIPGWLRHAAEGSAHKAALWGLALTTSAQVRRNAARVGLGASSPHGKIELFIPELEAEILGLAAEAERSTLELDPALPLVLNAGRHMERNANTLMRDPARGGSPGSMSAT